MATETLKDQTGKDKADILAVIDGMRKARHDKNVQAIAAPYTRTRLFSISPSRIIHSEKIYVRGDIHRNTIEGFWSLFNAWNRWRIPLRKREAFADVLR